MKSDRQPEPSIDTRKVFGKAIRGSENNWEKLYDLARSLILNIIQADCRNDRNRSGTYRLMYCQVCDYALQHLSSADYHRFCIRLIRFDQYIIRNM